MLLDLKKAFDSVDHTLLLAKLQLYGISNAVFNLFKSYLSDRSQMCSVNGKLSNSRIIKCEVPQGSVPDPLLFLVYINDLPNCLQLTTCRMFADDTNMSASGHTIEEIERILNIDH